MSDTTPRPNISGQNTNAGSGAFIRDEAKALIAAGLFDAKHPISDRFFGATKERYNAEFTRRIMALGRTAPAPDQPTATVFVGAEERALPRMNLSPLVSPLALSGRVIGVTARGLSTVGVLSVGINLADAAIKHDGDKAAGILGTTAATGLLMEGVAEMAGARAVPVVGEVIGGVFAAKDAYDAARSGHNVRAAASGIEAGLYAFSLGAALTGAGAPIALVAGGAAVTMTAARTLRDNWSTVSSWFDKWSNDFAARHAQPALPAPSSLKPRQLIVA